MTDRLSTALRHTQEWLVALAEEGPDLTARAHLKARDEAGEFAAEPSLDEAADVVMCVAGSMLNFKWSFDDLADAIERKLVINRARRWEKQADGTFQHVA